MQGSLVRAVAVVVFVAAPAGASERAALTAAREELRQAELALERVRRLVPYESSPAEAEERIRTWGARLEIPDLVIRRRGEAAPVMLTPTDPAPLRTVTLEIAGEGRIEAIDRLVRTAFRGGGLRLDSLTLEATAGPEVAFTARVSAAWFVDDEPPVAAAADLVTATRQRTARTLAIADAVADLVASPAARTLDGVASIARAIARHPIVFSSARLGPAVTLEGLLVGSPARAALRSATERAGYRTARERFVPEGRCQRFVLTLDPPQADPEFEPFLDPVFEHGEPSCVPENPRPPRRIEVGRPDAEPAARALRLRAMHLRDVFLVLNDSLGEDFVVAPDVAGRVTLEVSDEASIEELLAALETAGVTIGAGPLRLVANAADPPRDPAPAPIASRPVSLRLRDVAFAEVLCLVAELSGREILGPRELPRLAVFADDVGLDLLLGGMVAAAGFAVDEEEAVLRIGCERSPPSISPCVLAASAAPRSRLERLPGDPRELAGAADLTLAGLTRVGPDWKGWAYGPGGRLIPLEPGGRLFDASVDQVGPAGVRLSTGEGRSIEIGLEP